MPLRHVRLLDVCVLVFGLAYAGMYLTPVTYWYDTGEIIVKDGYFGEPLTMEYHGGAVREFRGSYSVVVRDFSTRSIACEAMSGQFTYEVGAPRPDPLPMKWWAPSDRRCIALPPGTYVMETCWTVHAAFGGVVPSKTACIGSNIFTMRPARY